MDPKQKAREILLGRRLSYKQAFNRESQAVKEVLEDLGRFCRASESCFHADPRLHALLEGRREVYLRIKDYIELPQEEFLKKYERIKE